MKLITVGRSNKNNIVVSDIKVSDEHAQIVVKCSIVDLNSANGTFVNDVRISGETPLKAGDRVRVGNTTLPWQNYMASAIPPAKAKSNKRRLIALILVALVAVALGVVTYLYVFAEKSAPEQIQREELPPVNEDIIREKMDSMAGLKIFAGSISLKYDYIHSIFESYDNKESITNLVNAYIKEPTGDNLDSLADFVINAITSKITDEGLSEDDITNEDIKKIERSVKLYLEIKSIEAKNSTR